jgi:hypothetical protein
MFDHPGEASLGFFWHAGAFILLITGYVYGQALRTVSIFSAAILRSWGDLGLLAVMMYLVQLMHISVATGEYVVTFFRHWRIGMKIPR